MQLLEGDGRHIAGGAMWQRYATECTIINLLSGWFQLHSAVVQYTLSNWSARYSRIIHYHSCTWTFVPMINVRAYCVWWYTHCIVFALVCRLWLAFGCTFQIMQCTNISTILWVHNIIPSAPPQPTLHSAGNIVIFKVNLVILVIWVVSRYAVCTYVRFFAKP